MSLQTKIIDIRVDLQEKNIKKSGHNKHAGFDYYELSDFLPHLNSMMKEREINDVFSIDSDFASLTLIHKEEKQTYTIPFEMFTVPMTNAGKPMMQQIQYLGALNTYYKRYLYMNAFGITDGEVIDGMPPIPEQPNKKPSPNDKQFQQFKERFTAGEDVLDKFKASFELTKDQQDWIDGQIK